MCCLWIYSYRFLQLTRCLLLIGLDVGLYAWLDLIRILCAKGRATLAEALKLHNSTTTRRRRWVHGMEWTLGPCIICKSQTRDNALRRSATAHGAMLYSRVRANAFQIYSRPTSQAFVSLSTTALRTPTTSCDCSRLEYPSLPERLYSSSNIDPTHLGYNSSWAWRL